MKDEEIKSIARELGRALKAKGHPVPHSVLLHAIAAVRGETDWHVHSAQAGKAGAVESPCVASTTVWAARYEHRHGADTQVFASLEAAEGWRTEIADEWWDQEFPGEGRPSQDDIGALYFERMRESTRPEFFSIEPQVVTGADSTARARPVPAPASADRKVWVACYDHEYGTDVQVFDTEALAEGWRTAIAKHWWDQEIDEEAPADDLIGAAYFRIKNDSDEPESFRIEQLPILSAPVSGY